MYYKEKMVKGVLCYKRTPDEEWNEMTTRDLSRRVCEAALDIKMYKELLRQIHRDIAQALD